MKKFSQYLMELDATAPAGTAPAPAQPQQPVANPMMQQIMSLLPRLSPQDLQGLSTHVQGMMGNGSRSQQWTGAGKPTPTVIGGNQVQQ